MTDGLRPPAKPPETIDPQLQPYATPTQWSHLIAWVQAGSITKAAKAIGVERSRLKTSIASVYKKAAQRGYAPDYDLTHPLPDGLVTKGTSVLYNAAGEVQQAWNKSRMEGSAPEERVQLPDPKTITKVSTLYDQQGRVTQQWVAEKPELVAQQMAWLEAAKALATTLPRVPPFPRQFESLIKTKDDLMTCYPVGDHHLGMLSWNQETGADWDLALGEEALASAVDYLVESAPQSTSAAVVFLGDFMHYDSFDTVTPSSRNLLDADGRYPKMVRASIRSMRHAIETAAKKHAKVHVIVEIGNHDLSSSIFLMEALANIYAENPRITIDTSPMHYHYFEHGACLVGTHHGHGAKPERLPSIMAADRPEAWGRTKFRYWWTGHIHTMTMRDFEACSVESFRILAPPDAWAHQKGYRATRDMKAIVLHKEHGEVARQTVNPGMFRR